MYNIKIVESNSPAITKRTFKHSITLTHSLNDYKNNSNKRRHSCLFKSLECFLKQCRKSSMNVYNLLTGAWVPIITIMWICYCIIKLPEYLLYILLYAIFITTDFLYKLYFQIYSKTALSLWRKNTKTPIESQIANSSDLTIVLDIDETLVFTTEDPPSMLDYEYFSVNDCENGIYYVYKRPYLDYFLSKASQLGRIIIFTASEKSYATQVIKNIGQDIVISGAYFRDVSLCKEDSHVYYNSTDM